MMKQSPFPTLGMFLRALTKALIIVLVVNALLLIAHINPIRELITLNTWDLLGRGRARLSYPSDFPNGQLPLESLFGAHMISEKPKPAGEFRVVLLGESGIAGWGVPDQDTLSAQLTRAGIAVGSKRLVAYNLAYPQPGAPRDLLILDAAIDYDPDLVIWFITPAALDNDPDIAGANRVFYNLNRNRLERLVAAYPDLLSNWYTSRAPALLDQPSGWQRYIAIQDQTLLPVWMNSLFYPFITPDLAHSDRRMGSEPVPEEARFTGDSPGFKEMPNESWNFLQVGCMHAENGGANLLLINEPMLVGSGPHSEANYNMNYQRALYDRYRKVLKSFTAQHQIAYRDLWNIIPSERFTDTPLHMDAQGYAILSAALRDVISEGAFNSSCAR